MSYSWSSLSDERPAHRQEKSVTKTMRVWAATAKTQKMILPAASLICVTKCSGTCVNLSPQSLTKPRFYMAVFLSANSPFWLKTMKALTEKRIAWTESRQPKPILWCYIPMLPRLHLPKRNMQKVAKLMMKPKA